MYRSLLKSPHIHGENRRELTHPLATIHFIFGTTGALDILKKMGLSSKVWRTRMFMPPTTILNRQSSTTQHSYSSIHNAGARLRRKLSRASRERATKKKPSTAGATSYENNKVATSIDAHYREDQASCRGESPSLASICHRWTTSLPSLPARYMPTANCGQSMEGVVHHGSHNGAQNAARMYRPAHFDNQQTPTTAGSTM